MGKKPVLGLVGLAWLGLVVGGCKDCNCGGGKSRKEVHPVAKRPAGQETSGRESEARVQRRTEGPSVATKGADPRPYDFDPNERDVPGSQELSAEKPAMAEHTAPRREGVPQRFSDPSSEAGIPPVKKETSTGVMPASGKTEIYEVPQPPTYGKGMPSAAAGSGPDLTGESVIPHTTALPRTEMSAGPASKSPPSFAGDKTNAAPALPVPPPAPGGAPAMRELESAASPLPLPSVNSLPPPPTVKSPSADLAPGGVVPAPVSNFPPPPPSSALQNGVKSEMPPLPPAPPGTAPLPTLARPGSDGGFGSRDH